MYCCFSHAVSRRRRRRRREIYKRKRRTAKTEQQQQLIVCLLYFPSLSQPTHPPIQSASPSLTHVLNSFFDWFSREAR